MSFIDSHPIVTLPRVSDLPLKSRVVIPVSPTDENHLDIGISKSNISNYITYPSPKLVWSYPISPSSIIECMDVKGSQYLIGITDRKTYKLLSLNRDTEEAKQIKFKSPVKNVKFTESIIVVLQNGEIVKLNDELQVTDHLNEAQGQYVYSYIGEFILIITKDSDQLKYKFINSGLADHYENYDEYIFDVYEDFIYRFNVNTKVVEKINFAYKVIQSIKLPLGNGPYSFAVLSEDRVVVSEQQKMILVNIKYDTKLAEYKFHDNSDNEIISSIKIKGNTINSSETTLFYVKLNSKKNKLNLNLTNVSVGFNNLLSNLNKGFDQSNDDIVEVIDLLSDDLSIKPDTTFSGLSQLYNKDLAQFETETLSYFKQQPIKPLHYYHFETSDRPVDSNFIYKLCQLIFNTESETIKINGKTPKYVVNYLLSHKLFPKDFTNGLLPLFSKSSNRLLKQCITSTPNIKLSELIDVMINGDSTLIHDILTRFSQFKVEDIIEEFKNQINQGNSSNGVLENLIKLDTLKGYQLLKNLIDLNGLVNNFDEEFLSKLQKFINYKIRIIELNSFNLNLINNRIEFGDSKLPSYSFEALEI